MVSLSKPYFDQREIDAVTAVVQSGNIVQGNKCREFEEEVAAFCEKKHAIATSSGSSSILLAAQALGVSQESSFITTPFTFVATVSPLLALGAKPVFVDISATDYCIDVEQIRSRISETTNLIVPVDLFGQVCRMDQIREIARQHDVRILEDACQAFGATYMGKKAGSFGDVGAFSFYATKIITTGEGGMIVTDDEELAQRLRQLRNHNQSDEGSYDYLGLGGNYRMTDIAASIGLAQMKKIDEIISRRRMIAHQYIQELMGVKGICLPETNPHANHSYNLFCIRVTNEHRLGRDGLLKVLQQHGIGVRVYYPKPLHEYEFLTRWGYKKGDFPVAEQMAHELLSVPMHPGLQEQDVMRIIRIIQDNS